MVKKKDLCDLVKSLRCSLRTIARELGYLDSNISEVNLTMPQIHALIEIERNETLTVAKLANILNLNESSTCRTIATLRKQGLVKTITLPNDKKQKPVKLTSLGKEKVNEINIFCNPYYEKVLEKIPSKKHSLIKNAFELYANALSKVSEELKE